jgi:hypothetical protein
MKSVAFVPLGLAFLVAGLPPARLRTGGALVDAVSGAEMVAVGAAVVAAD